jgi:Cys-tRNA(Pro) deacylase
VPRRKDERGAVATHVLVLVERRLDTVDAAGIGALADELGRRRIEPLGTLRDSFVHVSEQRLRPRLRLMVGHSSPVTRVFCEGTTAERGRRLRLSSQGVEEWPEPVERVAAVLRAQGVDARLEEFPEGTSTAEAAARAVGCEPAQIVKSLVFVSDGLPVLALVPGDRRADAGRVAAAAGAQSARIATPAEVLTATGFEAGGVAPFPIPRVSRVLIERELLRHELVWAGAGTPRHVVGLAPGDLARLTNGETADLVET